MVGGKYGSIIQCVVITLLIVPHSREYDDNNINRMATGSVELFFLLRLYHILLGFLYLLDKIKVNYHFHNNKTKATDDVTES